MFSSQIFEDMGDTPQKKVKLNESSTYANDSSMHSRSRGRKTSFFDRISLLHRQPKKQYAADPLQVSQFELPLEYRSSNSSMQDEMEQQAAQHQHSNKLILNRKFTLQIREQQDDQLINNLHLYRINSTCEQTRKQPEINLGDNIYLKRLNSKTQPFRPTLHEDYCQPRLRIQQDYEIEKNLKMTGRHHESYICLNKLQRIFYYVKKIVMNWSSNNYQFLQQLIAQQIRIYHTDPNDHFLRFYQEWFEENALYLTFEVAIESLADSNLASNKLRQIQIWDLLRDATSALKWLKQQHQLSHLNIKPSNILKCQNKFKLVDPYSSPHVLKNYIEKERENCSNWHYLAPEIRNFALLLEGLDFHQADIYSLGICIIKNLLGERYLPMEGKAMRNYMQKHLHGYSPSLMRVLMRMVSLDPQKRPRAEELCEINKREGGEVCRRRRFSI